MLNITPVRNFIKSNVIAFRGTNTVEKPSFNGKNLQPLAQDTVNFSTPTTQSLNKSLMEAFDNREACLSVHENGEIVKQDLESMLTGSLKEFIYDKDDNPEGFIEKIKTRVKTPQSIREKATTTLAKMIKDDKKAFDPESPEDIKANIGDIVGGRIILRNPSHENTSKIIDKLISLVERRENPLKITAIENYTNSELGDAYEYFSQKDLDRLKESVNNRFHTNLKVKTSEKNTGYMALHLDVDLSSDEYKRKNDNYKGEIQIVGDDVSKMKDVEDFRYKLKKGMEIRSGNPAYKAFSEYFLKNLKDEEGKSKFEDYTRIAYAKQRMKEPGETRKTKSGYFFPTPEECGITDLNSKLDFNILYKLKDLSDKIYDITKE